MFAHYDGVQEEQCLTWYFGGTSKKFKASGVARIFFREELMLKNSLVHVD